MVVVNVSTQKYPEDGDPADSSWTIVRLDTERPPM